MNTRFVYLAKTLVVNADAVETVEFIAAEQVCHVVLRKRGVDTAMTFPCSEDGFRDIVMQLNDSA